jgi:hypothetical protein
MKKSFFFVGILLTSVCGKSQTRLLERTDLLAKIKSELYYTYNNEFDKAREIIIDLKKEIPGHPVISFMDALVIYWEEFPLTPENTKSEQFISLLEETCQKGKDILDKDPESLEGLFFDLFARALFSQHWADNGKPGKVFPYLNSVYRQTLKGMEVQDRFKEFYFTSGLYNYYIEAYPEKHPAYKPIKLLFKSGDMEKGLFLLNYCAENAVYVKNEARYFLTHIYMAYESNPSKASEYASGLYREFPRNPLYAGKYTEILIYSSKYSVADNLVNNLLSIPGDFAKMEYHLYKALLDEKYKRDYESGFAGYKKALELCGKFGETSSPYKAVAYMGLGRYYRYKKDKSESNRNFRMAENFSTYDYVINDK